MNEEIRYLQYTDEADFRARIAELSEEGWEVKEETSRKDGSGMLFSAELVRAVSK
jgi:hypothetical protein